ncbi:putative SecA motor DEAD [Helianthus annuus]|nr:putative SecA motor DEAD [Helianthus annuus]
MSTNMAGRGTDILLGGNPKMLAKEVIEDIILSHMSQDIPDIDFEEPVSQKVLSKNENRAIIISFAG